MAALIAILAGFAGGLTIVLNQLRKAPVGYEDEQGFHIVHRLKGSAVIRHRKAKHTAAAALKRARAHS